MWRILDRPSWFLITLYSGHVIRIYGNAYDLGTMDHGEFATKEDPDRLYYRFYNSEELLIGYVPVNYVDSIKCQ